MEIIGALPPACAEVLLMRRECMQRLKLTARLGGQLEGKHALADGWFGKRTGKGKTPLLLPIWPIGMKRVVLDRLGHDKGERMG